MTNTMFNFSQLNLAKQVVEQLKKADSQEQRYKIIDCLDEAVLKLALLLFMEDYDHMERHAEGW